MADLENIIRAIHNLSHEEKVALRTVLDGELDTAPPATNGASQRSELIGLFADEPDVLDRVLESAYESRSRPLRSE